MDLEKIGKKIVASAIKVHSELGPGLPESAYPYCFMFKLRRRVFQVNHEVPLKYGIKRVVFNLPEPPWRLEHKG
jgi:GxxExxY protein